MVRSLPGTASRAVADAASGASERPTSQVVSPTTCDNIVNAVKVVDGFKGDVCSHAPPAPPESCKSGLESLWRRTCMTDGSNCDGLEHGAFTPSAVSNPRMQVRSRPTATQWQWRSDRRSTVAKRGRGTTGASADGDAFTCQGISRKSPMWLDEPHLSSNTFPLETSIFPERFPLERERFCACRRGGRTDSHCNGM